MNNFEATIGIEIHLELNTKTKMFSTTLNSSNAKPNTYASVVDLGYPGVLPVVNKEAIIKAIKLAKALKMDISNEIIFDRKNYFYYDLPKGFQITQFFHPFAKNGKVPILIGNKTKEILIRQIHIEEDTAKTIIRNNNVLLDYNRSGVPLIEIVTKPVISSPKEARLYVDMIRKIAKTLDISNAQMEKGSLRADINISLKRINSNKLGTKVEIKNLNSLSNIEKAIEYEIKIQKQKLIEKKPVLQVTKRFNEQTQKTETTRKKIDSIDYRYIQEPNIPVITLSKDDIEKVKIEELPWELTEKYRKLNLHDQYINNLVENKKLRIFFDQISFPDKLKVAKLLFSEFAAIANEKNLEIYELNITPNQITELLEKNQKNIISGKQLKMIIPKLVKSNLTIDQIIKKMNISQINDSGLIKNIIDKVIKANLEFFKKNLNREERITKFLIGNVMKETKGQANPVLTNKHVQEKIEELKKEN